MKSLGHAGLIFYYKGSGEMWREYIEVSICKNGSLGPFPLASEGSFLGLQTCGAGAAAAL